MSKFLSIGKASEFFGVSPQTLRRWERQGKLVAAKRTPGNQRRYDVSSLHPRKRIDDVLKELPTIAYARVSSHDQKEDLVRQQKMLELFCSSHGWSFEIITVFSARLYGSRSKKNKKLLEKLGAAVCDRDVKGD